MSLWDVLAQATGPLEFWRAREILREAEGYYSPLESLAEDLAVSGERPEVRASIDNLLAAIKVVGRDEANQAIRDRLEAMGQVPPEAKGKESYEWEFVDQAGVSHKAKAIAHWEAREKIVIFGDGNEAHAERTGEFYPSITRHTTIVDEKEV